MKILDDYNSCKQAIFDAFGYVEDWKVHPIEDMREVYWAYDGKYEQVQFFFQKEDIGKYSKLYSHEIGHDRFLPKYVYKGTGEAEGYTMILCDTQTDGNILLCIFDNKKNIAWQDSDEMEGYGDEADDVGGVHD